MKKLLALIPPFALALIVSMPVLAHGGVEHTTDDAIVTVYQTPLSPVAREHVQTDMIFTDKAGNRLKNMPVTLAVTDTHYGDESKDKQVLKREFKTNVDGILSFDYQYAKPDYYDIDLDFSVAGKSQEAGFLIQMRNPYKNWYSLTYIAALAAGAGLAWGITIWHSRRTSHTTISS